MNSPAPASPAGPAPDDGIVEVVARGLCAMEFPGSSWRACYGTDEWRAKARDYLRAHTAQPAAVVRCAECDCEAGGEACNWIKRGPAAGVLEVTLLTEYGSGVEAAYLEGFEDGWDQKQNDVWPFDKAQAMSWEDSQMHAALAAAPRAGVPEGWRLVPIEPTEEMLSAFHKAISVWMSEIGEDADVWRDMVAAAPQPKEPK